MPGRVVVRRGVADEIGVTQLVQIAVAVDADVVGDIDPAVEILVIALVLAQARGCVAVVARGTAVW